MVPFEVCPGDVGGNTTSLTRPLAVARMDIPAISLGAKP